MSEAVGFDVAAGASRHKGVEEGWHFHSEKIPELLLLELVFGHF